MKKIIILLIVIACFKSYAMELEAKDLLFKHLLQNPILIQPSLESGVLTLFDKNSEGITFGMAAEANQNALSAITAYVNKGELMHKQAKDFNIEHPQDRQDLISLACRDMYGNNMLHLVGLYKNQSLALYIGHRLLCGSISEKDFKNLLQQKNYLGLMPQQVLENVMTEEEKAACYSRFIRNTPTRYGHPLRFLLSKYQ